MEEQVSTFTQQQLIAQAYESYHKQVLLYITYKITDRSEAEDMAQDVFLRLMDYKQMLRPETVKCFIYTIARNLVTDYLRHYYKRQEYNTYMYDTTRDYSNCTEEQVIARDLAQHEHLKLSQMAPQRQKIYSLNRYEEMGAADIAERLNLSKRTVENHLLLGRKEMREYMKQCI